MQSEIAGLFIDSKDGKYVPRFICRYCQRPITDHEDGTVVFSENEGNVLHKRCNIELGDPMPYWLPLGHFMAYLMGNVGLRSSAAYEKEKREASLF